MTLRLTVPSVRMTLRLTVPSVRMTLRLTVRECVAMVVMCR